ncbi:MAG: potassium-transporting ATPase subunit KdpC [Verrucomicrobia bacterium]|nr:potassium-transporting ATPase subunit KdpC [Verrucomicrobiota bacterium]
MKNILSEIRPAIVSTIVLAVVLCGIYPLVVTGIAKLAFPNKANGSLLVNKDGIIIGSSLLGQNFSGEKYFHPRPSAAGPNGYDPTASGGSNFGPTSQKLADLIKQRIADYRATNGLTETQPVPANAVTASGSGLDPHITPANAALQVARVAKCRALPPEKIRDLIAANADRADFGLLGADGVNVLKLNLALDAIAPPKP